MKYLMVILALFMVGCASTGDSSKCNRNDPDSECYRPRPEHHFRGDI